jgi:hypothetical protein
MNSFKRLFAVIDQASEMIEQMAKGRVTDVHDGNPHDAADKSEHSKPVLEVLEKPKKKDKAEKAIKPGPTLNYGKMNPKQNMNVSPEAKTIVAEQRTAQEAAAPTINYGGTNQVKPAWSGAKQKASAVRQKLDSESKETALETIQRRIGKPANPEAKKSEYIDDDTAVMFADAVLEKAATKKLFDKMPEQPSIAISEMSKEDAARQVYWAIKELNEIESRKYMCESFPEAKEALEAHYKAAQEDLKDSLAKYKKAKPKSTLSKTPDAPIGVEELTKSVTATFSKTQITEMLSKSVSNGTLHRNVLLEWQNFGVINPAIMNVYSEFLKKKSYEDQLVKSQELGDNEVELVEWDDGNYDLHIGANVPESVANDLAKRLCKQFNCDELILPELDALEKKSFNLKAEHKSDNGGLTDKGRKAYNSATGSNLKKPQPEGGPRKKSFCARNKGQIDMHNIDCKKTPDKRACKARRRWKC